MRFCTKAHAAQHHAHDVLHIERPFGSSHCVSLSIPCKASKLPFGWLQMAYSYDWHEAAIQGFQLDADYLAHMKF